VFESEQQFQNDYRRALYNRGCKTDGQWLKVLEQVIKMLKLYNLTLFIIC